jgi:hypothetical protein
VGDEFASCSYWRGSGCKRATPFWGTQKMFS